MTVAGGENPRHKERGQTMNRAQKRAKRKETPRYLRTTKEERIKSLIRNGITTKDLEKEFQNGYDAGFADAAPAVVKTAYAAICLALQESRGFGQEECADVLQRVDDHILHSLTSAEAIEEVWNKIGLRINFEEPFERIEKA